jgi:hypothetical protein
MRLRNLVLAALAVVGGTTSARADLVLEFIPVASITSNGSTAPAVTSVNLTAGPTTPLFIQVALRDTNYGNTFPGTGSSIPATGAYPTPTWADPNNDPWPANTQEFGLVQHFTRIQNVLNIGQPTNMAQANIQPPNPDSTTDGQFGNANLRLVGGTSLPSSFIAGGSNAPLFSDFGGLSSSGFLLPNLIYGGLGATPTGALNGRVPLFNFRLEAPNALASGNEFIRLFDRSPDADFTVLRAGQNSADLANYITLDSTIFSAAHPNFNLSVNIIPVPEPTSMALCGLALGGLVYRKLRRKKEVVA